MRLLVPLDLVVLIDGLDYPELHPSIFHAMQLVGRIIPLRFAKSVKCIQPDPKTLPTSCLRVRSDTDHVIRFSFE